MYKLFIKPFLFCFSPEIAHKIVFWTWKLSYKIPFGKSVWRIFFSEKKIKRQNEKIGKTILGLHFPNPVGIGAGFDKNAEMLGGFAQMGFGFVEIGTVTPKPQAGNPKPRLFRLPKDYALINRMGFNNDGMTIIAQRIADFRQKYAQQKTSLQHQLIIGGNIGKNKDTPLEQAHNDYMLCFEALKNVVDYFVVNVSSPNTPNLRALQDKEPLLYLLQHLQQHNQKQAKPIPILLKIAPDLSFEQLDDVVDVILQTNIAGVIATNTTLSRQDLRTDIQTLDKIGLGGLSGKPLTQKSTEIITYLKAKSQNKFVIVGIGGIFSAKDALDKIQAGADLIQLYTGFVYEGTNLLKEIVKELGNKKH